MQLPLHSIDTPGVIDRVSTLFRGHPTLIQGFNTFLPAGYRIECNMDENADYITVTTPSGTRRQPIRDPFPGDPDAPGLRYAEPAALDEPQIERALSYVQKVKTRYANDPERYKQFLEILSSGDNAGPQALNDVSTHAYISMLLELTQRAGRCSSPCDTTLQR